MSHSMDAACIYLKKQAGVYVPASNKGLRKAKLADDFATLTAPQQDSMQLADEQPSGPCISKKRVSMVLVFGRLAISVSNKLESHLRSNNKQSSLLVTHFVESISKVHRRYFVRLRSLSESVP